MYIHTCQYIFPRGRIPLNNDSSLILTFMFPYPYWVQVQKYIAFYFKYNLSHFAKICLPKFEVGCMTNEPIHNSNRLSAWDRNRKNTGAREWLKHCEKFLKVHLKCLTNIWIIFIYISTLYTSLVIINTKQKKTQSKVGYLKR